MRMCMSKRTCHVYSSSVVFSRIRESFEGSLYRGKFVLGSRSVSPQPGAGCWPGATCAGTGEEEESHLRCHVVLECTRVLADSNDHRGMSQRRGPTRRKERETKQQCKALVLRRLRSRRKACVTCITRFERACYFVVFVAGVEQNAPRRGRSLAFTSTLIPLHPVRLIPYARWSLFMSSAIPVSVLRVPCDHLQRRKLIGSTVLTA